MELSLNTILLIYVSLIITILVIRELMGWNCDRKIRSVFQQNKGVIEASTILSKLPPPSRPESVGVEGVSWGREVELEELERDDMSQEEREYELERKMKEERKI